MRLSCEKVFVVLAAATMACSEATGPDLSERFYVLESINGQPLPAILSPIPEATVSVLSATLAFRANGEVIWTERRREVSDNVPREFTSTKTLYYRWSEHYVEIMASRTCDDAGVCQGFTGVFAGRQLQLTVGWFSPTTRIIYEYVEGAILD